MFCIICLWCFGLAGSGAPCDTALQNVMLVLFWVSWLQSISQFTCLQVTVLYIYMCNNMYTYSPLPKYPHKSHKKCGESHRSQAPRSTRLWEFRLCVEMLRDCLDSFSTHGLGPRGPVARRSPGLGWLGKSRCRDGGRDISDGRFRLKWSKSVVVYHSWLSPSS